MTSFKISVNEGERKRIKGKMKKIAGKYRGTAAVVGSKSMARRVMKYAKQLAPSRRIKQNFYLAKKGKKYAVINRCFLAHLFEFGTMGKGPSAHHFLRNAVMSARGSAARDAKKKIQKVIFEGV